MHSTLRILFFLLLLSNAASLSAQDVRVLIEDEGNNFSVAQYNFASNTLNNSFNLNSSALNGAFYAEATAFDYLSDQLVTFSDTSIVSIDVQTGTVSANPFPFPTSGGYNAAFRFSGVASLLYGVIEDANGDFSVVGYDYSSNSTVSSVSLNGTALANSGFYAASAVYDALRKEIVVSGGTNVYSVNVNTGAVTTNSLPFSGTQGYNFSMHYDRNLDELYGLYEDSNGDVKVATYDYTTNSLSNVVDLAGTSVASGFYAEGAGYDASLRTILVATDDGITSVNVVTGAVSLKSFPFAATNGFNIVLRPWVMVTSADPKSAGGLFSMSPNPASEMVHLRFETAKPGQLKLMDLEGRTLYERTVLGGEASLDVSQLPAGIYLAQFVNGVEAHTQKVVVE